MAQNKINMPGVFGGLMRYDDEYQSRFMITPAQVVGFIIAIIALVFVLKLFFPVTVPVEVGTPAPIPASILPFLK